MDFKRASCASQLGVFSKTEEQQQATTSPPSAHILQKEGGAGNYSWGIYQKTSPINRGNTHLASLPVGRQLGLELLSYHLFYIKYFYHLTILSVTCEWQVGQYLPFLSRTFRDKFVSIKKTIVYKIKKRRQNSENHKFIYLRRK